MPIEQLLAMYGYGGHPPETNPDLSSDSQGQDTRSSSEEEILSNHVCFEIKLKYFLFGTSNMSSNFVIWMD